MKKESAGFFTVDRRIWSRVCDLGMNDAVAYLVLAQGTGRDNCSTRWSATALHKYAGVSFERGVDAIERIIKRGFLQYGHKHTKAKPRYEIVPWGEFMQRSLASELSRLSVGEKSYLESLPIKGEFWEPYECRYLKRFETLLDAGLIWAGSEEHAYTRDLSPDPIWLPNTIVTGTTNGEDSPIRRLRRSGDIWALRLFVDLYHSHNLRDDGGISPWLFRKRFDRKQIGQHGIFTLWAFKSGGEELWWKGPLKVHRSRQHSNGVEHPVWSNIRLLEKLGLLSYIPHLWENDSPQAEVIHPYGTEDCDASEIEMEIAAAADEAVWNLARREPAWKQDLTTQIQRAYAEDFDLLLPCHSTIPDCILLGVARLRYRPHTSRTRAWYAELQKKGRGFIRGFEKLRGINELESSGCIKGNQSTSTRVKGLQGSSKKVNKTA